MKNDQMIPKRVNIFDVQHGDAVVFMLTTWCRVGIVIGIKEVDEEYMMQRGYPMERGRVFTIFANEQITNRVYSSRASLLVLR